jgi:hypothetical protein
MLSVSSLRLLSAALGLFAFSAAALAQPAGRTMPSVAGEVVADADGRPLPGATVVLRSPADSSLVTGAATDTEGRFRLPTVPNGTYWLDVSFVSFVTVRQVLVYEGRPVRVGTIRLREDARALEGVDVAADAIVAELRADTLVFDARQFQVNRDATAEDLVRRLPGATVQNGQVQVEGEAVARVTVDGREVFGGDPTTTLRNLPAEMVSQVETFEGMTDASRFSGFDDGERVRTVNLVSRTGFQSAAFGRAYGGYGDGETYQVGLNANIIQGQRRLNVLAQSNNVNQQNFAVEDLLGSSGGGSRMVRMGGGGRPGGGSFGGGEFGVPQQDGISTTHALGINYSDRWARRVDFSGSYFLNGSDNDLIQQLDQTFVSEELDGQRYDEATNRTTRAVNQRATGRLTVNFSPATALQINPRFSTQFRRTVSGIAGITQNDTGLLSEATDDETSRQLAASFSNEALFRHRFDASAVTVSFGLNTSYNNRDQASDLSSLTNVYQPAGVIRLDQNGDIGSSGLGFTATATASRSFGQAHAALLSAAVSTQETDSDRLYFDLLTGTAVVDSTLSAQLQSGLLTQRVGTGYRFRSDKLTLTTTVDLQRARQERTQSFPRVDDDAQTYLTVLPSISARYNWSRSRNVNLRFRINSDTPSIEQLDDAVTVSNALQVSRGNPDLRAETRLSGGMRFLNARFQEGRTFIVGASGDLSLDYVGTETTVATQPLEVSPDVTLPPGGRLTQSVNLDGRMSGRVFVSVGTPLKAIRSNLNVRLFTNHTRTPSRLNGEDRLTRSTLLGPGLSLTSNISPKVDFTLGTSSAVTLAQSDAADATDQRYLTQTSNLAFNVELPFGTVLRSDLMHQAYAGLDDVDPYLLWNASIGQKLMRGQAGELRLAVTDILNQNASYNRNVTDLYVQGLLANTLQRYVQLIFTYTIRPAGGR